MGGISQASILGYLSKLPSGYIRAGAKAKDHGLGNLIEGIEVSGKNILLFEDLVTTGGSVLECAEILKNAGAESITIVSIFSYDFMTARNNFASAGYPVTSIIYFDDLLSTLEKTLTHEEFNSLKEWKENVVNWFEKHKTEFDFGYLTTLRKSAKECGSIVCLGVDPVLESLPKGYAESGINGYASFITDVFSAMKEKKIFVGMLKPNHGFYEIHDKPFKNDFSGSNALAQIIRNFKNLFPGIPINLDFKRGDIGKSSANYATVGFDNWNSDAVTVHGYMGDDSVESFIKYCNKELEKGVYILCKTSNPGSKNFQMKRLQNGSLLHEEVAQTIIGWAKKHPGVGAVVGATDLLELSSIAKIFFNKDIPLLIPGVGSQGGSAKDVANVLRTANYELDLARINSSSGLTHPWYKPGMTPDQIPSASECIEMCVNAIDALNKEIAFAG